MDKLSIAGLVFTALFIIAADGGKKRTPTKYQEDLKESYFKHRLSRGLIKHSRTVDPNLVENIPSFETEPHTNLQEPDTDWRQIYQQTQTNFPAAWNAINEQPNLPGQNAGVGYIGPSSASIPQSTGYGQNSQLWSRSSRAGNVQNRDSGTGRYSPPPGLTILDSSRPDPNVGGRPIETFQSIRNKTGSRRKKTSTSNDGRSDKKGKHKKAKHSSANETESDLILINPRWLILNPFKDD